ncbi:VanZ family protein [Geoalkalibacter halelectricus]|uniref:VanZ family protein n=1 Tax=Geoalkalibacter halelectricus TaxID=2847045 RepID=UPI0026701C83|nr:VanZ family protein [Geoalkalibacter halelectricus]MDO3379928.1 VanZ family protein [Geoalkalibacter halelectricus]
MDVPLTAPPGGDLYWPWPHKDKVGHFLAYALMTLLGAWAWSGRRALTRRGLYTGLLIAAVFGGLMEILQGTLTTHRHAEFADFLANLGGALTAFAGGWWWVRRRNGVAS